MHEIGDQALTKVSGPKPKILYDLGLELGGLWRIPKGGRTIDNGDIIYQYAHVIWNDHVSKYGTADTMGFSISASNDTVMGSHEFYVSENRGLPIALGLDIYGAGHDANNFRVNFSQIVDELKGRALMDRAFIQKTYFDNPEVRQIIESVSSAKNARFRTMMQWPFKLGGYTTSDDSDVVPFDQYVDRVSIASENQDLTHTDVFNARWYLSHHSDLSAAFGGDLEAATRHWINIGVYRSAIHHFVNFGITERRAGRFSLRPEVFNLDWYPQARSDLQSAFGADTTAARDHWMNFGVFESRMGSPTFSSVSYLNRYTNGRP